MAGIQQRRSIDDKGINIMKDMYLKFTTLLFVFVMWVSGLSPLIAQDNLRNIPDPDPEQQLEMLYVAEGYEVNLFAAEPMVVKPIQMNWDAEGRLWVAGSTVYPHLEPGQEPDDKIYVLEDTDGDGVADKSTVFAEGLLMPTGILPGDGGVYVANSTEIIHLRDTNGDGKADERRVVLSGFGTADSHHLIHTFRWGPDDKFYFNQSIYIFSHVETPWGIRRMEGGGVWQFRPETRELEVHARGLVNPWGLQFDRWGHPFLTDGAGGEGINYGFRGATFLATPGAERILQGLSPGQPKHSGLDILSGRHLPEEMDGVFITNDFRANRINLFRLREQGHSFTAEQLEDLLWTDHVAFRPVDVTVGPDGAIYVADWYNPIIQHGEVDFRDERRDQQHGRIWRITAKDRPLVEPPALADAGPRELLDALKLPENWTRSQARQLLKEMGAERVVPELERGLADLDPEDEADEHHLLAAYWVCQALQVLNEPLLNQLVGADDPQARAAAVRSLYEWQDDLPLTEILGGAVRDDHPHVRHEAIIALRDLETPEAAEMALSVLDRTMDEVMDFSLWQTIRLLEPWWMGRLNEDPEYLSDPRQRAYALKSVGIQEAVRHLVELYLSGQVPQEYHDDVLDAVARWGDTEELNILYEIALGTEFIHSDGRIAYLDALEEAKQRQGKQPDRDLTELSRLLATGDGEVTERVVELIGLWKVTPLRDDLVQLVTEGEDPIQRTALQALSAMGDEESRRILTEWTSAGNPELLRVRAASRLIDFDLEETAVRTVAVLQDLQTGESGRSGPDGALQGEAVSETELMELFNRFLSRSGGAKALAEPLAQQRVPEQFAKAGRRAMQRSRLSEEESEALAAALEASGGVLPPERMPQNLSDQQINTLEREIRATADPVAGEKVFRRGALMCMNCHAVGGAGGQAGPDLSSLGTSMPTDNIIRKILDPNANVKEGYELTRVVRRDGSVVNGTLIRETPSEVVLRNVGDQEISIPRNQVETHETVSGSLMPPGLTAALEREEFIDLVGYLSRLGETGDFRIPDQVFARRWRALAGGSTTATALAELGPEALIQQSLPGGSEAGQSGNSLPWYNAYSTVSGQLPIEDIPVIELDSGERFSLVRFDLEMLNTGRVELGVNGSEGIRLRANGEWVESTGVSGAGGGMASASINLQEGVHPVTVMIDRTAFDGEGLSIWLQPGSDTTGRARFVIGK